MEKFTSSFILEGLCRLAFQSKAAFIPFFDGEGTTGDEEKMRELWRRRDLSEDLHEARELSGVDVGVRLCCS